MPTVPGMGAGRALGGEIERKTAEIEDWPAWAKPYDPPTRPSGDERPVREPLPNAGDRPAMGYRPGCSHP